MNYVKINRFPPLGYAGNEAINTLCTNLSFSRENMRKIMVTSSHASEGKSFISMNIMRTLTKLGKTVALVDADMRRSAIISRYGFQYPVGCPKKGLAHLLAGMASEADVIYQTNIKGAWMVPIGREILDSLSLLVSPRFEALLNHLAEKVDYVIVDAPPVGAVIDAAEIAKSCDGILMVVGYNAVRRQELIEAKMQLEQTGCPILGAILNQVDFDNYFTKKYYYKSYQADYYSDQLENERRTRKERPKASKRG